MTKKIIIEQDENLNMLSIRTAEDISIFYGNEWDFDRSGNSFKKLFEKLGLEVEILDVDMSDEFNYE